MIPTPLSLLAALTTVAATTPTPAPPTAIRGEGPAGSVLIVDPSHAVPLIHVVVAARTGSAADPRGSEGLANLAAELARRGAGGRGREELDDALANLGATLDVLIDPDATRFAGQVLARNLDPFLALLADIIVRPDFDASELERTRREILGQIDEARNDDRWLCARFFQRRLFGDHPYGRASDGTARSLARLPRNHLMAHFRSTWVGRNLVFAAAGDITPEAFRTRLERAFRGLREGPPPPRIDIRPPRPPQGWRIQLVDKPDRQQTQIMFGHVGVPAAHPDFVPLSLALAAFGGRAMNASLMDEVRTKRGLAYGAYMGPSARRGPSPIVGWVFSGAERTVTTLKLVLRLYRRFMKNGLTAERLLFFQTYLAGSSAAEMDAPDQRLRARVAAEIEGLPPDFVDTFADRIRAVTLAQVTKAIAKHVHADDLAITLVASADAMTKLLTKAGIDPGSIDVVGYESY